MSVACSVHGRALGSGWRRFSSLVQASASSAGRTGAYPAGPGQNITDTDGRGVEGNRDDQQDRLNKRHEPGHFAMTSDTEHKDDGRPQHYKQRQCDKEHNTLLETAQVAVTDQPQHEFSDGQPGQYRSRNAQIGPE